MNPHKCLRCGGPLRKSEYHWICIGCGEHHAMAPTVGEVWDALNRIADAVRADDRDEYISAVERARAVSCTDAQIADAFYHPIHYDHSLQWPSFPQWVPKGVA